MISEQIWTNYPHRSRKSESDAAVAIAIWNFKNENDKKFRCLDEKDVLSGWIKDSNRFYHEMKKRDDFLGN